ncbi:MAG TPA: ADP-ribosylglycohydrolase, partial [Desulfomicrobium sp.]|nr:ADP-ribosylglycohydrolase [Desulfomicrobium sp.]
ILTGALAGAQTGLSGIPWRFVDGLQRGSELLELAERLAEQTAV